eukprot:jgi/Bigna1/89110/estExt_fgenesh1_pg.C_440011
MNVQVIVRVRPLLANDKKFANRQKKEVQRQQRSGKGLPHDLHSCVDAVSSNALEVSYQHPVNGKELVREFAFDKVMNHKTSQKNFFETCGIKELIQTTLQGYAAVVFAYGQTGSGKTYTMSGKEQQVAQDGFRSPETDGLIPRSLSYLYAQIYAAKKEGKEVSISSSYLEIYNEQVFDLLSNESSALPVRYQFGRGFFVERQLMVECEGFEDLCAVAAEGHNNRTVRSHSLNMHSSRSHSLFTVYVEVKDEDEEGEVTSVYGKITFIDLAGSENVKQSQSEGVALKETNNINKSLFALGKVISVLAAKHEGKLGELGHVPYRDSVLTKLLMDSLGGNGLAMMIACCSPSNFHCDETLRTLQYATRAKNIKNRPVQNVSQRGSSDAQHLKSMVKRLQNENHYLRQILSANGIDAPPPGNIPLLSQAAAAYNSNNDISSPEDGLPPRRPMNLAKLDTNSGNSAISPQSSEWWKKAALSFPDTPLQEKKGSVQMQRANLKMAMSAISSAAARTPSRKSIEATQTAAGERKKYSRSQERIAQRLERRSSRRNMRRSPRKTGDHEISGNGGGGIKEAAIAEDMTISREQRLAQENRQLKSRLHRLETIFVKGKASTPASISRRRGEIAVNTGIINTPPGSARRVMGNDPSTSSSNEDAAAIVSTDPPMSSGDGGRVSLGMGRYSSAGYRPSSLDIRPTRSLGSSRASTIYGSLQGHQQQQQQPHQQQTHHGSFSGRSRLGTTGSSGSINVVTPNRLPSYTSVVSSANPTPAVSRGPTSRTPTTIPEVRNSQSIRAHVSMNHPFFADISSDM